MKYWFLSLLLLVPFVGVRAGEFGGENPLKVQVKGFLDSYHAIRAGGGYDWMSSRTRARGELKLEKGPSSLFVSLNTVYNGILKDKTALDLREAYMYYAKDGWDLRMGRQIVVWGVADAIRVTDCVSPFDYSEFLARDYDDIRMPVNGLRARYSTGLITLEALCVPVSDFFILPTDKSNPWAVSLPSAALPYTFDLESGKPEKKLRNIEYGGRLCVNSNGIDFSLSALRTWNKLPAFMPTLSSDFSSLLIKGVYHRLSILGADFSIPWGNCVIRGEAGLYKGEAQSVNLGSAVVRRNSMNALLGLDWYPGHDWNLSLQYYHKHILGELAGLPVFADSGLATARISKEFMGGVFKVSSFAYVDVANGGVFNRLALSYNLSDQMELSGGYDYFNADKGNFVMYKDNSEAWFKMKYSF